MWLCFNDGLLSVVADQKDPTRLMVRARRKKDLVAVAGAGAEILETPKNDYRWRTFLSREAFTKLVAERIGRIDYPNFKNSVPDRDLHDLYTEFWSLHHHYGRTDPAIPEK